ncbi:MAG TPA: TolC family protein [Candidatus Saccharimonadales bacterium]|jgi:outer membrane protein|nr:TolC family protein [Candidatus Saccharimonadales bacterium]
MLRVTTQKKRSKVLLTVEGRLAGESVSTLELCWRELRAASPSEKFNVDLCGVSFIDAAGKTLLKEIHRQGGHLVAQGCLNQATVKEITGERKASDEHAHKKDTKRSHIIFYIAFFSLLIVPASTRAQGQPQPQQSRSPLPAQAPTGVMRLTLDQAVALALKQNTTARIAVLTAAQSEQDQKIALSQLLPQADLGVSEEWQRANILAQFGGTRIFPGFPGHIGPYSIFSAGPSFSGPLFDLTLFRRYQASRHAANASRSDSLSTREQVILLVVSQYIGTLRSIADVQASQSRVELAQALYDQAADLQKEGVGTGIDTLRANVELQNENQRLLEAQAARETSLFGLSRLLNLDPRQQIDLGDSLAFFDTPQPDIEASIEEGLAARPEWKSLQEQMRASENLKKAAFASRLPSVHFNGNWEQLGTEPSSVIPTYTYAGSVSMPLFTGGRIRAETVRADLDIQKLQQQQADLRNQIALDVKTALINLDSARSQVRVANLGVQLSREEVDQARDRFNAGVANNIEVIQAQDSLARANDNQIAALYRFNQARADLARSVGEMEKVYAK